MPDNVTAAQTEYSHCHCHKATKSLFNAYLNQVVTTATFENTDSGFVVEKTLLFNLKTAASGQH